MMYYILNSVVQNELLQAIEVGSSSHSHSHHHHNQTPGLAAGPAWQGPGPAEDEEAFGVFDEAAGVLGSAGDNCTTSNSTGGFNKPFFITWWNHSFMIIVLPPVLLYLVSCAAPAHATATATVTATAVCAPCTLRLCARRVPCACVAARA